MAGSEQNERQADLYHECNPQSCWLLKASNGNKVAPNDSDMNVRILSTAIVVEPAYPSQYNR